MKQSLNLKVAQPLLLITQLKQSLQLLPLSLLNPEKETRQALDNKPQQQRHESQQLNRTEKMDKHTKSTKAIQRHNYAQPNWGVSDPRLNSHL